MYILDLLDGTEVLGGKESTTPMNQNHNTS